MSMLRETLAPLWVLCRVTVISGIAAAILFGGCSSTGVRTERPAAPQSEAAPPGEFSWARNIAEARGSAHMPMNLAGAQQELYARQSAKTAAISNLKTAISKLTVYENVTVDAIMRQNLAVRRAIENYLQHAEVIGTGEIQPGEYEVRVRARLQPVADILKQHQYAPDYMPPGPAPADSDVPPIS